MALNRFASWCIQGGGWWWWRFEASWIAATHIGAQALNNVKLQQWTDPFFEAFISGVWFLYWTDDTLYWVAKPGVHVEVVEGNRRLHRQDGPAIESDVENLYFWHGVMVPAFVVVRPEWITVAHIDAEQNAEVRRVMIERYGLSRYLLDAKAIELHRDDFGILYRREFGDDEPLVMVKVVNSTPEVDGSFRDYFLRVPPDITTAREAVAWTFGKQESEYSPQVET